MNFKNLILIAAITKVSSALESINFCGVKNTVCFNIKADGNDRIVTMTGPANTGYQALGIGNGMTDADIYVGFFGKNGKPYISYRKSEGYELPTPYEDQSSVSLVENMSKIESTQKVITFRIKANPNQKPKIALDGNDKLIWAFSSRAPKKDDASSGFSKHSDRGYYPLRY